MTGLDESTAIEVLSLFVLSISSMFLFTLTGVGNESIFLLGYFTLHTVNVAKNTEPTLGHAVGYLLFAIGPAALIDCIQFAKVIRRLPFFLLCFWFPCLAFAFFGGSMMIKYESTTYIRLTGLAIVLATLVTTIVDRYYGRSNSEISRQRMEDANDDYFDLIDATDDYDDSLSDGDDATMNEDKEGPEQTEDPLERLASGKKLKKSNNNNGTKKKKRVRKSKRISQIMLRAENAHNDAFYISLDRYKVNTPAMFAHLTISGLLSGLMAGLFGVNGLPLTVFGITNEVELRVVRCLSAVSIAAGLSLSYSLNLFVMNDGYFNRKQGPLYGAVLVGSLLGMFIGDVIGSSKVESQTIRKGIYATLVCGGLAMILFDLGKVSLLPSIFFLFFDAGLILYVFARLVEDATFANDESERERDSGKLGFEPNHSVYQSL